MTGKAFSVTDRITQLLDHMDKQAEAKTEPGSIGGSSSHPTASVDDQTSTADGGERAAEHTEAAKNLTPAATVEHTSDLTSEVNTQDKRQPNQGPKQSGVGEDPATENNYKDKKDEPGTLTGSTSSPVVFGTEKYGSLSLPQMDALVRQLGAEVLRDLTELQKQAQQQQATSAAQAGYSAAAATSQPDVTQQNAAFLRATVMEAKTAADLTAAKLRQVFAKSQKRAAEGMTEGEDHSAEGDEGSGEGPIGGGSEEMPAGPGGPGGDPAMDAMLAEQAGAAGPGGAPGGAPGGQPSQEEAMQALLEAMQQLGITPEMLMEMANNSGGAGGGMPPDAGGGMPPGAGGGMPPDAGGGMPPMDPAAGGDPAMGAKMAAAAHRAQLCKAAAVAVAKFKNSGRANSPRAKTARAAALVPNMKNYLKEMLFRS